MRGRHHTTHISFALLAAAALAVLGSAPARAIDWGAVEGREVVLFYPGQASWEWVLTQSDHSGAKKFRGGKNCKECHGGEEPAIGKLIVSGKKLEPTPPAGKRGSIPLDVKTAHDGERLYFRFEWPEAGEGVAGTGEHRAAVTVMIGDESLTEAPRAGCWGACHDDAVGMASAREGVDLTKYVLGSRTKVTREGGGENYKSADALEAMLDAGAFFEYWQAELGEDGSATAKSGYILERRHESKGGGVSAEAELSDGMWTVVLSRPLAAPGPGHKDLAADTAYAVGFAVHAAHAEHRFHHVSFEHSLRLDGGDTDFVARRQ